MKKKLLFLLILIVFITGCSGEEVKNNSVKVVPSKLFQGDAKSLEPHMDMITGCVDVNYKGSKENMGLKYEIWKDGALEAKNNLLSTPIEGNGFNGEISISLKDTMTANFERSESIGMKTVLRTEDGHSASSIPIDRFNEEYGYSPKELQNEINVTDNKEIAIWGLEAGETLSAGGEDIEKAVKKAKWGLILKLYFD